METTTLKVTTGGSFAAAELTGEVRRWLAGRGDGLACLFTPHATAGLALMETGSGSETDLQSVLSELLPRSEGRWVHGHGSPGHGADHLLPVFVSPSVTVPVSGGEPAFGTWQSLVLVDTNVDNAERRVQLSFLPG